MQVRCDEAKEWDGLHVGALYTVYALAPVDGRLMFLLQDPKMHAPYWYPAKQFHITQDCYSTFWTPATSAGGEFSLAPEGWHQGSRNFHDYDEQQPEARAAWLKVKEQLDLEQELCEDPAWPLSFTYLGEHFVVSDLEELEAVLVDFDSEAAASSTILTDRLGRRIDFAVKDYVSIRPPKVYRFDRVSYYG